MALTRQQRNRLPDSAFLIPSRRAYPMPTATQARNAGISEAQRLRTHRNALSRAAQPQTGASYPKAARMARSRTGGKIATVSRSTGTVSRSGVRRR